MPEANKPNIVPVKMDSPAKTQKKSEASKLAELFLADDFANAPDRVFKEVVVPKIIDGVIAAVTTGLNYIFKTGVGSSSTTTYTPNVQNINYGAFSSGSVSAWSGSTSKTPMFDEIIFPNANVATQVMNQMKQLIAQYNVATVGNMFDLAGVKSPHTAENYGWTDFSTAKVVRVANGYVIKTPRCMPVD